MPLRTPSEAPGANFHFQLCLAAPDVIAMPSEPAANPGSP